MVGERPALVIGYGNTLRSDDAAGPLAAEVVRDWALPGVVALAVPQLTPELAEPLASVRLAVFVDARVDSNDGPAGVEVSLVEPSETSSPFGHIGDPGSLLALAQAAYGVCPVAWLVTVPAVELGLGEGLSVRASRGLDEALGRIADLLGSNPGYGFETPFSRASCS